MTRWEATRRSLTIWSNAVGECLVTIVYAADLLLHRSQRHRLCSCRAVTSVAVFQPYPAANKGS